VNGDDPALRERLETMRDMALFLEGEFPALLQRWQGELRRA